MRNTNWLFKLAVVLLCGAILLGSAVGDDGFYVIATGFRLPYSGSGNYAGYLLDVTNSGGPAIHAWGDYGVVGENAGYWGCVGYSDGGVVGLSNSSFYWGYLGRNDLGGFFYGDVQINGTLYKSAGSFKIDHPLDPANKYLSHSFVESSDMKNIYDGVAELDGSGEAWIELPEYFEALNRDFRYQLTCISGFAPVYIAKKIAGNRFKIAGGAPGLEVSWQVTGIRKDAYANAHRIPVEEFKNAEEAGYYIHPQLFGKPEEKQLEWVRSPKLMREIKERRERQKQAKNP